jgi:hypothetical protein
MKFFICLVLIVISFKSISQTRVDTLIQNYLLENKEIDTIIYKEQKQKNNISVESNYFNDKVLEFKRNNCLITAYQFGSNSSHRTAFVLLDFYCNKLHSYKFFGKENLETELENLLLIFQSNQYELENSDKKKLIEAVLKIYN